MHHLNGGTRTALEATTAQHQRALSHADVGHSQVRVGERLVEPPLHLLLELSAYDHARALGIARARFEAERERQLPVELQRPGARHPSSGTADEPQRRAGLCL